MHASLFMVGLGALAAQALAGGVDTIVDTTIVTITSCGPEVESCPGKTPARPTTTEVTETSTYCPPTVGVASTVPSVALPATSSAVVAPTYPAIPVASSVTVSLSEVPGTTSISSAAPVTTAASNVSVPAYPASIPAPSSAPIPSSAPVGPPTYTNSTQTAPALPGNETGILTATGTPTPATLTSVVVVPPTTAHPVGSASSTTATPKATGAAGRLVVPGISLALLAAAVVFLG